MADEVLSMYVGPGIQTDGGPRKQDENLKPTMFTHNQDPIVARENGRKGGIKSGEVRRRNRKMRDAAKFLLQQRMILGDDTVYDIARKMGLDPEDATNADALIIAAALKAMKGDVEAMKFVRDTGGEAPKNQVELSGDTDRPIATMDLRAMSEDELLRLADARANETDEPADAKE